MGILDNTEPKRVMHYFEEISSIPRGSGNTKEICDYCENFAKAHSLSFARDEFNNCIIEKPSKISSESVILQGHTDMVCEKTADCNIDMAKEAIRLCKDDKYIWADKTTLGGDDGIALAMIFAVLESENLPLPNITAIFTSDEEIGMIGAQQLDMSGVRAKKLINIDSEEEGTFTVGCAGGCTAECKLPITREMTCEDAYEIKISGLTGGHSGTEIHRGRLNACVLLGRALKAVGNVKIAEVHGGGKDNAIATSASAVVFSDCDITGFAEMLTKTFSHEAPLEDKNVKVEIIACGKKEDLIFDEKSSETAIDLLLSIPWGVQSMSCEIDGLVRTSLNPGILKTDDNEMIISFSVRSMLQSEKEMLIEKLGAIMNLIGGNLAIKGDYPAWEYAGNTELCKLMTEVYRRQYSENPRIEAIHAGLECGLFCGKSEGMECISIGPDIFDIHTPSEKLDIESVCRVWKFLLGVLEAMYK